MLLCCFVFLCYFHFSQSPFCHTSYFTFSLLLRYSNYSL
jgi:hypothetical protein